MARDVLLRHPASGIVRKAHYGFSWTILFFNGIPIIFRGDFVVGLLMLFFSALGVVIPEGMKGGVVATFYVISGFVSAFAYNDHATLKMLERGYEFHDSDERVTAARKALNFPDSNNV